MDLKRLAGGGFQQISQERKKGPEGPYFNDLQTSMELCRS